MYWCFNCNKVNKGEEKDGQVRCSWCNQLFEDNNGIINKLMAENREKANIK